MRISDWSSDVCSSDLGIRPEHDRRVADRPPDAIGTVASEQMVERGAIAKRGRFAGRRIRALFFPQGSEGAEVERHQRRTRRLRTRSEEHTSELQSLMRISYAVFCLKKKKRKKPKEHPTEIHKQILSPSDDI